MWKKRLREDNDNSNRNCTVYDFEANYLDLEIKARHEADSVFGHEKRGMALKQLCASVCSLFSSHCIALKQMRVDNDLAIITSLCDDQVE